MNGVLVVVQRILKITPVASLTYTTLFWFGLTVYENLVGSIIGTKGFKRPPPIATFLSFSLAATGLWGLTSGRVKIKVT